MSYTVIFSTAARRQFLKLPSQAQRQLQPRIDQLMENPRPFGSLKLKGASGSYRVRVGEYRVIYGVDNARQLVIVFEVFRRKGRTDY